MRNPLSTSTASSRSRRRLLATFAAASMAVSGAVAMTAQAEPVTIEPAPTPAPTPALTPAPTPILAPSYGTLCADPAPGAVARYYEVAAVTSTTASVSWSMGFGCFRMGITARLEVDGQLYATSVGGPFGLSGGFTVTGLEPGSTHTLKVTAAEYGSDPRTLGGSEITTPLTDPTPAPATPVPTPATPTPTPTPTLPAPSPTPVPIPNPESIVDHIDVLDLTPTSATLSWGETVADPLYYLITVSGYPDIPTQQEGTKRLTNLTPGTTYNVRVFSRGGGVFFPGFDTFAIQFTTPTVGGPVPTPAGPTPAPTPSPTGGTVCNEIGPPTSEIRYRVLQVTPTTARIFYHYGAGCFQAPVTGTYEVDGQVRATLNGFSGIYTVTGLEPGSTHHVKVTGNAGGSDGGPRVLADLTITTPLVTPTPVPTPSLAPTPTPVAPTPIIDRPIPYAYALSGSATLKTLTKGSLPLSGAIDAKLTLPSGDFTGDLTLAPATGNLTALGFLPVTAKVNLVPTDKVVGSLKSGKLTAVAKVRIKLPSVKTLGIELAGGANCQAKQISSITLTSTQPQFKPLSGGPIAGTFSISDLSGCGFLTGIVSPLTKGSGNLIALNLAPKPITP